MSSSGPTAPAASGVPQPKAVTELSAQLRAVYAQAWADIERRELAIANDLLGRRAERLARIRELKDTVSTLMAHVDDQARAWVSQGLPKVYAMGAVDAAAGAFAWSTPHLDAVTELARDSYDDLLGATRYVRRTTKDFISAAVRESAAVAIIGGETATKAAKDAAARLVEEHGIHAVRYANGARHGLADYADLVLRTKTALAYNEGTFRQLEQAEIKYVEIFDGSGCGLTSHDDPQRASGLVLPLEEARAYPIAHPRCVMPGGRFVPYGDLQEMVRAWYSGPALELVAGAHSLTVGPHHPVLTGRGWLPAHLVEEGDQLVEDLRLRHHLVADVPGRLNLEEMPAVEDVFVTAGEAAVAGLRADDLHGDAVFCEGKVEVVWPVGVLRHVLDAPGFEQTGEHDLVRTDEGQAPLPGLRERVGVLRGARLAAEGGSGATHPVFDIGLGAHQETHRGGPVAGFHGAADCGLGDAEPLTDLACTEPRGVELFGGGTVEPLSDAAAAGVGAQPLSAPGTTWAERLPARVAGSLGHVVILGRVCDIRVTHYEGWVYDASTTEGAFTLNGFVVKNCQRSFSGRPDVTSKAQAKRAGPSTTAEQRADAAAAEAERIADQQRRATTRRRAVAAREARAARRAARVDRKG